MTRIHSSLAVAVIGCLLPLAAADFQVLLILAEPAAESSSGA